MGRGYPKPQPEPKETGPWDVPASDHGHELVPVVETLGSRPHVDRYEAPYVPLTVYRE